MIASSSALHVRSAREFVNYRHVCGAMLAVASLLLPSATRAQTAPVAAGGKITLFAAEKKGADASPSANALLRKTTSLKESEQKPVRFRKKQFVVLSAAVYAAAFADMHQTLHVRHYWWWYETDPMARPFAKLPSPAYYATGFALATGVNWLSWKMGHSRKWHKLAPLPQLLAIAGNAYGFRSNCYQNY